MSTDLLPFLVGTLAAVPVSLLGVFVVARRLALTGDALSHVALPGIALGITLGFDPFAGAVGFLVIGVFLSEFVTSRTKIRAEVIIGVLFSFALAVGVVLTPEHELIEALFGDIAKVGANDLWVTLALTLTLLLFIVRNLRSFALLSFSEDLAGTDPRSRRAELLLITLVALSVALGIKVTGVLFVGSLLIIPAAAANNVARSLRQSVFLSMVIGILSVVLGIAGSKFFAIEPGAGIVLAESAFFVLSFLISILRAK